MKGLMIGQWYAAYGLGYVIDINVEGIHLITKNILSVKTFIIMY